MSITVFIIFMVLLLAWNVAFPEKDDGIDPMPANPKSPKV